MEKQNQMRSILRDALESAAEIEKAKRLFSLKGRGHEPRVTLDRQLAAILRGANLPLVKISGYGANNYYPRRIFETAQEILCRRKGNPKIKFNQDKAFCDIPA